jgi:hypothetical protein
VRFSTSSTHPGVPAKRRYITGRPQPAVHPAELAVWQLGTSGICRSFARLNNAGTGNNSARQTGAQYEAKSVTGAILPGQPRIMPSGSIQRPSEGIGELIQDRKQTISQSVSDQK